MMQTKLHFLILDDANTSNEAKKLLETAGYTVTISSVHSNPRAAVIKHKPDCVLYNQHSMTENGVALFNEIKNISPTKHHPCFILLTERRFNPDRQAVLKTGISGCLFKPIHANTFVGDLLEIINEQMVIQFWGIRGTLPVPGAKSTRYGGNTNCVTLSYAKRLFFIFDAGTGIKELSNYLIAQNEFPLSAKVFITHPHYDHINGVPFFRPFYMEGNEFEIFGTKHSDMKIEKLLEGQMDKVYFPITMNEFNAKIKFHNLGEEKFNIEDLQIETIILNHPGKCIGFKVVHAKKSFCYLTDNELYLKTSEQYREAEVNRIINFIKDSDFLIIDTTYNDEQYEKKMGWGHSCVSRVVEVVDQAKVKQFCLYHHDPDQTDKDIDTKLAYARSLLKARGSKTEVIAPHEGDKFII